MPPKKDPKGAAKGKGAKEKAPAGGSDDKGELKANLKNAGSIKS